MKKLLFLIAFAFCSSALFAQISEVQKIFEKYEDVEGVTSIKVAKPMFNILRNLKIDDEDVQKIQPMLSKVNSLNILITKSAIPDSVLAKKPELKLQSEKLQLLQSQINNAVKSLKYEELVTVNSDGRKIKLLTASSTGDILSNLLLSITGSDQNVLMLLDGQVSMNEVSKFVNDSNK